MKLRYLAAAGAAVLGVAALTAPTMASAEIVCSADGAACWHVHRHYDYKPEWGLVVHDDSWKWGPNDHYVWKEHHGRGYWQNGVWVAF